MHLRSPLRDRVDRALSDAIRADGRCLGGSVY